jgi:hypothetical protein
MRAEDPNGFWSPKGPYGSLHPQLGAFVGAGESYVEGGDAVVVVGGTRAMVMLTVLPIFTWTPAAGC